MYTHASAMPAFVGLGHRYGCGKSLLLGGVAQPGVLHGVMRAHGASTERKVPNRSMSVVALPWCSCKNNTYKSIKMKHINNELVGKSKLNP